MSETIAFVGLGTIGWVPAGLGVVDGEQIPYLPWAAARKKENLEHWMDRDPEIKCFPAQDFILKALTFKPITLGLGRI